MNNRLLWADDEIDLLKPHLMFLKNKGYDVSTANNGADALDMVRGGEHFDLIILDENMPGITGLEALQQIKKLVPDVPVIMITKSEEEDIMDQAVGSKIADYLIKPVNPNQILLSIKKNLHSDQLVSQKTTDDYRRDFARIAGMINDAATLEDWMQLYRQLTLWEIELAGMSENALAETLAAQKDEANAEFTKFVRRNYERWVEAEGGHRPLMSDGVMKNSVFPLLDKGEKVFMVVIDNFRYDQWCSVRGALSESFNIDERLYCSILPTATQYARNAIFSGLMPLQISKMFPQLWVDEDSDEGKNLNESPMITTLFDRYRRKCRFSYHKINDSAGAEKLLRELPNLDQNDLNVVVLNFIDMLSHSRTESRMMRELASSDAAYRSLSESWFRHSNTLELFKRIASRGYTVVLTTDHGTIRVDNPLKIVGDKGTNTNIRYKVGRNLSYNNRQVVELKHPVRCGLPEPNVSSVYVMATGRDFFVYPNNYNQYVSHFEGTFQHGGVSMDEMLVPLVTLTPKNRYEKGV